MMPKPASSSSFSTMSVETTETKASCYPRFDELPNLHPDSKRALADNMGFTIMTEIQAKTYGPAVSGKDVLGRARTGTGKTIAFLLPSIQQFLTLTTNTTNTKPPTVPVAPGRDRIRMLILSPTRELAAQIGEQAQQLLTTNNNNNNNNNNKKKKKTIISHQVVFGGSSKPKDVKAFERRVPTILVATPGRLRDHLQTTTVRGEPFAELLKDTEILVLDEMDRLLDMGFRREVNDIISYLVSPNRQTLLFSATVPDDVKAIIRKTMKRDFVTVDCIHDADPSSHTNAQVQQTHCLLPSGTSLVSGTVRILQHIIETESPEDLKLVVFFATANLVAYYAALFQQGLGIDVLELHSRKSQSYRTKTSDQFREADNAILFTSDVSARGVDYPGVSHVVQFGIADSRESYIHRLGRTGRAGKVGQGLIVLSDIETGFLKNLDGLDVSLNREMQSLIDCPPAAAEETTKLDLALMSVRSERNQGLAKNARDAYRSVLGFYNGKLSKLGYGGTDSLVSFCNGFAMQAGLNEVPELELKTARKMGLDRANGLNIVKTSQARNKNNNNNNNNSTLPRQYQTQQQRGAGNSNANRAPRRGRRGGGGSGEPGQGGLSPAKRSNSIGPPAFTNKKPKQQQNALEASGELSSHRSNSRRPRSNKNNNNRSNRRRGGS